jgi:hypothetical protein
MSRATDIYPAISVKIVFRVVVGWLGLVQPLFLLD